jgi:hypothetical protein
MNNRPTKKPLKKSTKNVDDLKKILSQYDAHDRPFNEKLFSNLIEEFLHSFILVGYTAKGDPIAITSAKSQQEIDALHTNLQRFIFMFVSSSSMRPEDDSDPGLDE